MRHFRKPWRWLLLLAGLVWVIFWSALAMGFIQAPSALPS